MGLKFDQRYFTRREYHSGSRRLKDLFFNVFLKLYVRFRELDQTTERKLRIQVWECAAGCGALYGGYIDQTVCRTLREPSGVLPAARPARQGSV